MEGFINKTKGGSMGFLSRFVDSAAGVLAGPIEAYEQTRSRAEKLLARMNMGDKDALAEIKSRHNDQSWEFYAVIVQNGTDFDLRDPGGSWRNSNRVDLDVPSSCTLPSNFGGLGS